MTTPPRSPLLTTTLAVPAGEALRVTVVADTHSSPNPAALVHLRRLGPHAILHAGDIGDPAVLDALAEIAPCSTGAIRVASDLVFV